MEKQKQKRSYLTTEEALSFGSFLHSDLRRYIKQEESKAKIENNIKDFIPWTQAIRIVTKEDLNTWKKLYREHGIRNFNDIKYLIELV